MRKILFILTLLVATAGIAQQTPEHTMYRFNPVMLNPAATGYRDALSVVGIYRWQWVGDLAGAPQTGSFALHSPLRNDRLALGLSFVNDRVTVWQTNSINASFAYRIPVGKAKKVKISLGINAGATNVTGDLAQLRIQHPDEKFTNSTAWMPDLGAGVYVYGPKFFVGASVNNLLAPSLLKGGNLVQTTDSNRLYIHTFATAGYVFDLGKKVKFAPSVLMKYVPAHAPVTFDFNANFIIIDRIWLGVSYRLSESYGFMGAFNITPQWRVGYAYDLIVNDLKKFTNGSHEIMMGYDFDFRRSRIVNPRYVRYF